MEVFFMDVIWPAEFAAAGWAVPLNRFFPASEQREFLEAPILTNTYRGRIYGVPVFVDAGMLYYRKQLLDNYAFSVPRSWRFSRNDVLELVSTKPMGISDNG